MVNSEVTIYHKKLNTTTRLDEWIRYNYDNTFVTGGKGANLNKGYENANDIKVRIWYSLNNVSISNISIGDIIVKGKLAKNITSKSELKGYDVYDVTTIVDNNYGSYNMQHIDLGGK